MVKKLTMPNGASVIEGEGGGIREVFRSAQERGLDRPRLVDTGVQFTAWMSRLRAGDIARPGEPPVEVSVSETTGPTSSVPAASSAPTRHEGVVLQALTSSAVPLGEIVEATGLTGRQVRYALRLPLEEGVVEMVGGQGHKDTTYRLTATARATEGAEK